MATYARKGNDFLYIYFLINTDDTRLGIYLLVSGADIAVHNFTSGGVVLYEGIFAVVFKPLNVMCVYLI